MEIRAEVEPGAVERCRQECVASVLTYGGLEWSASQVRLDRDPPSGSPVTVS